MSGRCRATHCHGLPVFFIATAAFGIRHTEIIETVSVCDFDFFYVIRDEVEGRIGHLHDDVILLLRPESSSGLLSCAN